MTFVPNIFRVLLLITLMIIPYMGSVLAEDRCIIINNSGTEAINVENFTVMIDKNITIQMVGFTLQPMTEIRIGLDFVDNSTIDSIQNQTDSTVTPTTEIEAADNGNEDYVMVNEDDGITGELEASDQHGFGESSSGVFDSSAYKVPTEAEFKRVY